jgi:hypothetical protein
MMRLSVALLAVCLASAQTAKPVAMSKGTAAARGFKIAPQTFRDLERRFDARLEGLVRDPNEPVDLLGETRGVHVEGYGIVFTAVVSLVKTPELNPFLREIPKERADHIHQLRVDRLPVLKAAMREMMHLMAMTFAIQIPPDQKVLLEVRLKYGTWENTVGMPAHVLMTATRGGIQLDEIQEEVQ